MKLLEMDEDTKARAEVARDMAAEVLPCVCGRRDAAPLRHDETCPARSRAWLASTLFAMVAPGYVAQVRIPCTCGAERTAALHPESCPAAHREAVVGHIRQAAMQTVADGSTLDACQGALAAVRAAKGGDVSKDIRRCLSAAERTLASVFEVLLEER